MFDNFLPIVGKILQKFTFFPEDSTINSILSIIIVLEHVVTSNQNY